MNLAHWRQDEHGWTLPLALGAATADPLRGLTLRRGGHSPLGPLLGVQVVSAYDLEDELPLAEAGHPPEVFARQDVLVAQFRPTPRRQVECHARWRIHDESVFDLEVSTLTPGQWHGLAVNTASHLPPGDFEIIPTSVDLRPIVLCRPTGQDFSWLEMCHPHDGLLLDVTNAGTLCFHLFEHDLEKGVILRGRLRGQLLPKQATAEAALAAYAAFVSEPPNLSM